MRKSVYVVTLLLLLSFILTLSAGAGDLPGAQPHNRPISESPSLPISESLLSPNSPDVNVIYVDASATGANDGSSWANAYTDLAETLAQAAPNTFLWVAEGTYTPGSERSDSFALKSDVYILGGFPTGGGDGTFEARFPAAHETVLSGEIGLPGPDDNSYHVVTADSTVDDISLLDGVSIAHGVGNSDDLADAGSGLFIDGSRVYMQNCMIYDNRTSGNGPALAARNGAEVIIYNCTIAANSGPRGSALDIVDSELRLLNSTLRDNHTSTDAGPLWMSNSQSTIINSVFVNNTNSVPALGVITVQGGTSMINHVSIVGHNQAGLDVGDFGAAETTVTVTNSIFWDNGAVEMSVTGGSVLTISDSLVKGGFPGGTNILTSNPDFIDAPAGDLRLAVFSPAINAANLNSCDEIDRQGYPRPIGSGCDMGAHETPQRNSVCSAPGLAIPDNDPAGVKDSVDVGLSGLILDVDVSINATHPYVGDLNAAIRQENSGIVRTILDRPVYPDAQAVCNGDNIDATFDDEGGAPADKSCSAAPPALAGHLVPTRPLAVFDRRRLNSTWTLSVRDLSAGDTGTLNSWCLNVEWIPALSVTRADDPEPDGCVPGDCSLREAIIASNASTDVDEIITFAVDGPFVLSWPGAGEQLAATGDLDIRDTVAIVGNGTDSTIIDGGALDRVFDVSFSGIAVTFSDLTIRNGQLDPVDGFAAGAGLNVVGGGTNVTLRRTIVRDNFAIASGSGTGMGGALSVSGGIVLVYDSAILGNNADEAAAIYNTHGSLRISNSTIFGNNGGYQTIFNDGDTSLNMVNTTVAANTSDVVLNTFVNDAAENATIYMVNNIISGEGVHCDKRIEGAGNITIISDGHNIIGDDSCELDEPTDLPNTDPLLGPLADNGGPTPTAALLKGSPALDAGSDNSCSANDQRGLTRIDRDGNGDGGADNNPCDIGAYELQAAFTNTPPVADPQTVNVVKDTIKNFTLTGSDADGDPLTFEIVTNPANGNLLGQFPNIAYQPNQGFTGSDSFTFRVNDGKDDSPPATVTINVSAAPPPNTPPVANPQSLTTPMDTIKNFTLTGSDADNDPLTFQIVDSPLNGNLLGQFPNIAYQPNSGYIGADSFTFRVHDGTEYSPPATVSITVTENASGIMLYLPAIVR